MNEGLNIIIQVITFLVFISGFTLFITILGLILFLKVIDIFRERKIKRKVEKMRDEIDWGNDLFLHDKKGLIKTIIMRKNKKIVHL